MLLSEGAEMVTANFAKTQLSYNRVSCTNLSRPVIKCTNRFNEDTKNATLIRRRDSSGAFVKEQVRKAEGWCMFSYPLGWKKRGGPGGIMLRPLRCGGRPLKPGCPGGGGGPCL